MRSSVNVVKYLCLSLLAAASLVVFAGITDVKVHATDSMIEVRVCGAQSSATISIDQPASDSTVDRQPIIISGQLHDVSQVSVMVDGSYSHSLAIARGQTTYQTPVAVTSGTHTIEVIGNDTCGLADPSAAVVVTYTPATPPSSGGDTPTNVPSDSSSVSGGGFTVGGIPDGQSGINNDQNRIVNPDWLSTLPAPVRKFMRVTDLYTVAQDGVVAGIFRVGSILVGIAMIIWGSVVAGRPRARLRRLAPYQRPLTLQLIGFGLIVLALIL